VGSTETWYNDQWYAMLGYEPGELPGTVATFQQLCHPDDVVRVRDAFAEYIAGRSSAYRIEFRMRSKGGAWRWIHSQARAAEHNADGKPLRIAGVHLDVTERREIETQLVSAQRLESVGQLAAGIAHEINTPVQYISDSVYFARDGVRELLALVQELRAALPHDQAHDDLKYLQDNLPAALNRAVDGLARVTEIVRSMKEFSHPDPQQMGPVDINRAVQNTLLVAKSEYRYVADIDTRLGELPAVVGHGGEINQVMLNLVINAAHAIAAVVKDGGERGRIVVETRCDDDSVVISVADTGGGIPEAVRHRIFEPFFTTKEVGKGTGQGLSIACNIVRRHGGSLSFQTEIGSGTTFQVRLPIRSAPDEADVAAA
jgi:PAS domain S-box-containing protein